MTVRLAYVELNLAHGDIQPTFWWLADQAGAEIEFHVLPPVRDLCPLGRVPGPATVHAIDVADLHDPCATPFDDGAWTDPDRYHAVVLGTAEPADRVRAALRSPLPQLHVVHNGRHPAVAEPRVTACVLAPAAAPLLSPAPVLVEPWYVGAPRPDGAAPSTGPLVVSVIGNVQLRRRNYAALVRALAELRRDGVGPDHLRVDLVGRAFGREPYLDGRLRTDGDRIGRMLRDAGVEDLVTVAPRELTYPEVYAAAARSHHVLPLVDEYFLPARPYLEGKYTSALGVGLGAGAVPLLSRRHAEVVDVDVGPRYAGDDVAAGLRAALDRRDRHADDRAAVVALRHERLGASAARFTQWLEGALP